MADVVYKQSVEIIAGKNPQGGGSIKEKDFEIAPPEVLIIDDLNEDNYSRFVIPDGAVDVPLCAGTVTTMKVAIVKPEADLDIKLVNGNGTSQTITLIGGRPSIFHMTLSNILVSNSTGTAIKGRFFAAGD